MSNRKKILWDKYKANQILKKDGFGPFRAAGLVSFINHQCTDCHSKLSLTALSNALEITETGIVFLCMKCRGVEHRLTQEEIKSFKDYRHDMTYWDPEKDSFKKSNINQYKVLTNLDSSYHFYDSSYPAFDPILSIDVVMYIRMGVHGHIQQGNYHSNWVPQNKYSSFYNNWEKLGHCPECGGFLRNNFHSPYKTQIEEKHECPHCTISIDAFWNYRNTLKSDVEKLLELLKYDDPKKMKINAKTLEIMEKRDPKTGSTGVFNL